MEEFSGVSNWLLTVQREEDGITLLRARTCDKRAVLPDSLFGLPVTGLGRHALSPTAAPVDGEEVRITCGLGSGEWDNTALEELTLPETIRSVGDYAFLNCRTLRKLRLHDSVESWGGGSMINCPSLYAFHITWGEEQGDTLAYFADALSREIEVTVDAPFGQFRLVFPEYVELYEENGPARNFDYNIMGAGYPYHHCFRDKKLNFLEYDSLWKGYLSMEYEEATALRLAWYRLRYPVELNETAREAYRSYLQAHIRKTLEWLLEEGNASDLSKLLQWTEPTREDLSYITAKARDLGAAEALAVLLETQNRRFSRKKSFDL